VAEPRFPLERIPAEIRTIAETLRDAGHEVWYVGGAVRDVLIEQARGRPAVREGDFDIATSATPEVVQGLFRRTVPVGVEHGTVAVLDQHGGAHEVTTFRRDVKTDGRHAVVEFGVSLDDDLARRDFTINAVAVHPWTGELKDPFGGRDDLAARRLKAVGDAATRFREDRLRVLRGLRFAAALELEIDAPTWEAMRAAASDLAHLSRERVRDEWVKMLATSRASTGVNLWRRAGVLGEVWPELRDLSEAAVARLDDVGPRDAVLLTAAALHRAGVSAEAAKSAVLRLRYSNHDAERVAAIAEGLTGVLPEPGDARAVRRWLARHREHARDIVAASEPPARRAALLLAVERVFAEREPLSLKDLAINGQDLMAAGVLPGPAMGDLLRRLLEEVLDDPSRNTREYLLARAKELTRGKAPA
jgi:tRNA nucleotidyltransferase (CCA-adding enzyme)